MLSVSILAAAIIDRCIPLGRVEARDFARYLSQVRTRFDWSTTATGERAIVGMSGNKAALTIAAEMAAQLTDESGANVIREIQEQLRARLAQQQ